MKLTGIVAMTGDRVIGRDGGLPWHLPADLAFFKKTTLGCPIVMGRKTYESIGRALPGRRNIVVTRDTSWHAPQVEVIHGAEELSALKDLPQQVYVIGGAEVYKAFMSLLDDLVVSHVTDEVIGDTYFPVFEDEFPKVEVLAEHEGFIVKRWSRSEDASRGSAL